MEKVSKNDENAQMVSKSNIPVELNMDQKVTVRNIAGWPVGFRRIETQGDVMIPKNGSIRLTRSEILAQAQSGSRLFNGVDGRGTHATLYIDDEATRIELDYDNKDEGRKQTVLTDEIVKKLFGYKSTKSFEENLHKYVFTRAESYAITEIIKKLKLNDHDKIRIIENYTGFKI